MENARKNVSVSWPTSLIEFVQGPLFEKTKLKQSYSSEKAMEDFIKEQGMWEEYEKFKGVI
jgi:hypothetical protein